MKGIYIVANDWGLDNTIALLISIKFMMISFKK